MKAAVTDSWGGGKQLATTIDKLTPIYRLGADAPEHKALLGDAADDASRAPVLSKLGVSKSEFDVYLQLRAAHRALATRSAKNPSRSSVAKRDDASILSASACNSERST
jgi:hypothetical protein